MTTFDYSINFVKLAVLLGILVFADTASAQDKSKQIDVTYENYNQAETARNFNNWAKMGGNNQFGHRKELGPIGPDAPTIRLNLDTLYSVGVFNNDGEMSLTIPESDVYQSVMVLDTDGYTPFFFVKPGTYTLKHDPEYLFVAARTGVKNRHSKASVAAARKAQEGLKVEGHGPKPYVMPLYNQNQLHALTAEYNKKFLASGIAFVFSDGKKSINEDHRRWSNAAGWGGMVTKVGESNFYTTSENLPGDKPMKVTFPNPGNKFFTSFTIYDVNGYLMDGKDQHISSYTWEPNKDETITIHFNAEGKKNNISSGGKDFNYIVRNYGASQAVIEKKINPIKPELIE